MPPRRAIHAIAIGLLAIPGLLLCAGASSAGGPSNHGILPPRLKDMPLPGVAGEHARLQKEDAVRFLSPFNIQIASGRSEEVDLRFEVAAGFHINSHTPHDKNLIPTQLAMLEPRGVKILAVSFPPGTDYAPEFAPKEKLNVYSGVFALRMRLRVREGDHALKGALRYQACDANACLPPRTLPIEVAIHAVGAAGR